jgi:phosphatidate cytidylyltransferase
LASSKASRIWKRTAVGFSLLAPLAGLLLWFDRSGDTRILAVVGSLLLLTAVAELHRMGTWASLGLGPRLLPGALVLSWIYLQPREPDSVALGVLAQYVWVALAALATHGLAMLARGLALPAIALAWAVLVIFFPGEFASGEWLAATRVPLAVLAGASLVVSALRSPGSAAARRHVGLVLLLSLWVTVPLLAVSEVAGRFGPSGLVSLLILSKIGDIAGYYVGSALGKTHPFPGISPGKTTAGCVGSLVAGCLAGLLCVSAGWLPTGSLGLAGGLLLGAVTNLAAQAGDLFESALKRRAGVKDSGTCLGPAGGILDLTDSLLFTVPLALAAWDWFLR